jgi:hypothetical protein
MAMGSKKYAPTTRGGPKPHCPEHDVLLVMVMIMPNKRIVGACPKGHQISRGQWVNK